MYVLNYTKTIPINQGEYGCKDNKKYMKKYRNRFQRPFCSPVFSESTFLTSGMERFIADILFFVVQPPKDVIGTQNADQFSLL